ncbi:MAG: TolC family protein [gamma proteobacterium endosymbiont of Lamellibrachia anaximandri]|nr:TolC family protein [gamma proteobacterium endosymbiont of Lamellibrachia anaximandri]MBL3534551.1 TolC family protein [gamma proteobacterium endosymbiont of Lamellibrachia anaximandri]MBL3599104.1 TolC family protein [gamma proteobacterium endosymbiont of Lamellibrachia anaximandri]
MDFLRIRPFVGLILWMLSALANAASLTEDYSLQLGLNQADFIRLLDSRVDAAQGNLLDRQTWVNPVLELSREVAGDETEINLWLHQKLDLSGQRHLNRDAAQVGLGVAEAHNQVQRIQRGAEIRQHFYQLLFQQRQQQLFSHWLTKFSEMEAVMEKREAVGDVSGYDRRRISRERVAILSQQRQSAAQHAAGWQQLRGIIGLENSRGFDTVEGQLIPAELRSLSSVKESFAHPPTLLQQQRQAEASRLTARAIARSHIPEITVGLGVKSIDAPGVSDSGLMLSASIPLPLFDRKQGARQQAAAEATQAESEYQLALLRTGTRVRALWHKAGLLRANARLFSEQSVAASYELVRIAETSYHANEIGVLELIDAYRSALEAETTALKLALEARLIRIELDEITAGVYQ